MHELKGNEDVSWPYLILSYLIQAEIGDHVALYIDPCLLVTQ